jgi:general transcription factor 3C polypeptide 3 (transcription factor C subunit 4)
MRKFIRQRPLENAPIRLFQAAFASGFSAINTFSNSHIQKFVLRQVRAADNAIRGSGSVARTIISKDTRLQEAGDEDEQSGDDEEGGDDSPTAGRFHPTKSNPILHALYGQMLLTSKSYLSALG